MAGTKLTDGTYTIRNMLYTGTCPFILPLPDPSPQQYIVSGGGNLLTDAFGSEWVWNAGSERYEQAREHMGTPYTAWKQFWNGPGSDDGISIHDYSGSPWETRYECSHTKNQ